MPELLVDGRAVRVPEGATLLEAARSLGIHVPTLCHLPGAPHHTSCMVCLVEELGSGVLLPACATPARPGQRIRTDGPRVAAARRRSLELLLSEHAGDCEAPCTRACPAQPDLPAMIRRIARQEPSAARAVLLERLPLAGTLAAICPAPCERACRRGRLDSPLSIRALRQEALRQGANAPSCGPEQQGRGSVAVVGGGPAGLATAWFLARRGCSCTVFDDHQAPGGPLQGLVAEGRLAPDVLAADLAELRRLGVSWRSGRVVTPRSLEAIRREYDAVVFAPGSPERLRELAPGERFDRGTTAGSLRGIFACGNATRTRPSSLAVQAVADGRRAALGAAAFLEGLPAPPERRRFDSHLESVVGRLSREDLAALAAANGAAPATSPGPSDRDDAGAARVSAAGAARVSAAGAARVSAAGAESPDMLQEARRCLRCDCIRKGSCELRELSGRYEADSGRFAAERGERGGPGGGSRIGASGGLCLDPGKCIKCGICVRIAERAGTLPGLAFTARGYELRLRVPFDQGLEAALGESAGECTRHCPTGALAWCPPLCPAGPTQGGKP